MEKMQRQNNVPIVQMLSNCRSRPQTSNDVYCQNTVLSIEYIGNFAYTYLHTKRHTHTQTHWFDIFHIQTTHKVHSLK